MRITVVDLSQNKLANYDSTILPRIDDHLLIRGLTGGTKVVMVHDVLLDYDGPEGERARVRVTMGGIVPTNW
jgi:hypothetical protein